MISNLFNSVFSLYSNEITGRDTKGGITRGLVQKYKNVPCYDTYIQGEEEYNYGKRIVYAERRLFCLPTIQIKSTYLVRIIDDDGDNWYAVLYIDDCDDLQHHYEIDLLWIQSPQEVYGSSESSSSSSETISESSSSSYSTSSESSSSIGQSTTSSMSSSTSSITESYSSSSSITETSSSSYSESSFSSVSSGSNTTSTSSMSTSSSSSSHSI